MKSKKKKQALLGPYDPMAQVSEQKQIMMAHSTDPKISCLCSPTYLFKLAKSYDQLSNISCRTMFDEHTSATLHCIERSMGT